jgi:hypothetical protein
MIITSFVSPLITSILLIIFMMLLGFLMSHIDGDIHSLASDHIRASLFSIKRLTLRLFSSLYLFLIGLALSSGKFPLFMFATGVIMLLTVLASRRYLRGNYGQIAHIDPIILK